MKLLEIHIENFGIFSDRRWDLSGNSFQLIHGPNEAGKSTLLQLIRELLFGFRDRGNPYAFESHTGDMAASAVVDMADGRRIRFRRRKGRKGTVTGQVDGSAQKINDAALSAILGDASADLYQHVFGFSLHELSRGEDSLKSANLNEALFGGSLGSLANLQQTQAELTKESEKLFTPRAKTGSVVNRLLGEIRQQDKELRDATLKPRDYEAQEKAAREARELVGSFDASREEIAQQRAHVARLCDAMGPWQELRVARDELKQISIPAGLSASSGPEFERLQSDIGKATSSLAQARSDLASIEEGLQALHLEPELLAAEATIRTLDKDVTRIEQNAAQAPQLLTQSREIRADVEEQIRQLNPDWDASCFDSHQTSLVQREKVERLADELAELERRQAELTSQRPRLQKALDTQEQRLAGLQSVEPDSRLADLVRQEERYRLWHDQLAETQVDMDAVERKLKAQRQRLISVLSDPECADSELARLPVPLEATLVEYRNRWQSDRDACGKADDELARQQQQLAGCRAELSSLDEQQPVPNREELDDTRSRRDEGWSLIREQYVDAVESDDIEKRISDWTGADPQSLPKLFEQAITDADHLADARQPSAELVAKRERLVSEIHEQQRLVEQATAKREAARHRLDELTTEWDRQWTDMGLSPQSADAMLEWRRSFVDWLEQRGELHRLQTRQDELQSHIDGFVSQLTEAAGRHAVFADCDADDADQLLSQARLHVDAVQSAQLERQQLNESLPISQQELVELDQELELLKEQQQEWQCRWSQFLKELGFPTDWDVNATAKILSGLSEARHKHQQSQRLDEQARVLNGQVQQFEQQVREACRELSPELESLPAADAITRLSERLAVARSDAQEQKSLRKLLQKAAKHLQVSEQESAKLLSQQTALLEAAGTESPDEFLQLAAQAEKQSGLLAEVDRLNRDLRRIAGSSDVETFLSELDATDADTLELRREHVEREHENIGAERDEAVRKDDRAQELLRGMDGEGKTTAMQLGLESRYAQLGAAVDRFVPLVLAQTLLKRAIERFEKEHQPGMLAEVGRLLGHMTNGRHVGIRRRLDEEGTMLIEQHDGKLKTPAQLSTGTREQLYLAIRLAYVQQYCCDSEPLPLVMDDILVNFDPERSRRTLDVLFELSSKIQVLFLTCHTHTLDLVRSAQPDLQPVCLTED
jgi:uncharacterized protein YhaN